MESAPDPTANDDGIIVSSDAHSSNGRTTVSGTVNRGSNPRWAAMFGNPVPFGKLIRLEMPSRRGAANNEQLAAQEFSGAKLPDKGIPITLG